MPTTIHLDYETRGVVDLTQCGAFRYANDPSTEILCIGLAVGDEEPVVYVPSPSDRFFGQYDYDQFDRAVEILKMLSDPDTLVFAHNSLFEIAITDALFERTTGFKPPAHHQWRCTMAMARRAALPASLEKCAESLNLEQKKDKRGKALIKMFCIPQKDGQFAQPTDHPKEFAEFLEYCRQDVRAEREIHKKLKHFELTGSVLDTFQADLEMNCRGFPVNIDALQKAKALVDDVVKEAEIEFQECTGLMPTQGVKFLAWLKERGFPGDDLKAETLDEQIDDLSFDPMSEVGRALLLKQKVSFAAVKKIDSMLACAGPQDNRVRGSFQYHGASTGRWSGSLVQPQNFKRPTISHTEEAYADLCKGYDQGYFEMVYGPILEVMSSCIRHFIHGSTPFFNADYAAIEARIVCWLAGQEDALDEYRNNVDRYVRMASAIFNKPEGQINKHPERFVGKQATLGCGFGMSGPKFRGTCEKYQYYDLEKGLEFKAVEAFREKHPMVVKYWYDCEKAAVNAIKAPGRRFHVRNVSFVVAKTAGIGYLFIKLPSGRSLAYPHVKLEPLVSWKRAGVTEQIINPTPAQIDRAAKEDPKYMYKESSITYWGKPPTKSVWTRLSSYYGRIVENITQAVAADIMAHGTVNASRKGFHTLMLVHDESVCQWRAGATIEQFIECLTDLPPWADGLPIEAEGDIIPYYRK